MVAIRTQEEIELLRQAGHIVAKCHQAVKNSVAPGIRSIELDQLVEDVILSYGAYPIFKGYRNFPSATCISVNDGVVHGIPSDRVLNQGDIVSVDIGVKYKNYISDSAWTYPVGEISSERSYLLRHTEQALWTGLRVIKEGIHLSDISHAIGSYAQAHNLSVVKELTGHGVGTELHEDPYVLNYGKPHRGIILKAGMVLAIEPILNMGDAAIRTLKDGWSIVTKDGQDSAHFEHTIAVTKEGFTVLSTL